MDTSSVCRYSCGIAIHVSVPNETNAARVTGLPIDSDRDSMKHDWNQRIVTPLEPVVFLGGVLILVGNLYGFLLAFDSRFFVCERND